jgi:hypothetical protein
MANTECLITGGFKVFMNLRQYSEQKEILFMSGSVETMFFDKTDTPGRYFILETYICNPTSPGGEIGSPTMNVRIQMRTTKVLTQR